MASAMGDKKRSVLSYIKWEQFAAGVSGGVLSTVVLHPLDLIKVRFQVNEGIALSASRRPQYQGIIHALSTIRRQAGVRGLYQGVLPNVWGAGASWGLYFLFYNALKQSSQSAEGSTVLSPAQHMVAAAEAGVMTLVLTNPIWVVKTRLCLQYERSSGPPANATPSVKSAYYRGLIDCFRRTYKAEGMRGLYKGFLPGMFGVSHGALQFMVYEELKKMYNNYRRVPLDTRFSDFEYLGFAALSKVFAASVTYPYQVVRSRLQDQHRHYTGVMDVVIQTYRNEGLKGFYKGLAPSLLRVVPACCITFLVYENMVHFLLTHNR